MIGAAEKNVSENAWLEKGILALDYLKERLPSTPTTLSFDA